MASNRKPDPSSTTVKAVLDYARQLREEADRAKARDPHAELYRPSNDTARKLSSQLGPAEALTMLATRAKLVELRVAEENLRSTEGRRRLREYQLVAVGERVAIRSRQSLGQRLDAALLRLGVQSDVSAARLDAEPVSGSRSEGVPSRRRDRQLDDALFDARRAVERLEREAEHGRRRAVESEREAA